MVSRLALYAIGLPLVAVAPVMAQEQPSEMLDLVEAGMLVCTGAPDREDAEAARRLRCELSVPGRPEVEVYTGSIRDSGYAGQSLTQWRVLAPRHEEAGGGALEGAYQAGTSGLPPQWNADSYLIGGIDGAILLLPLAVHQGQELEVGDAVAKLQLAWINV